MLKELLLSILPEKIQASFYKKKGYKKGLITEKVIDDMNFIQVRYSKNVRTALLIDIDDKEKFTSMENIITFCEAINFPVPTIVVETQKGFHAWWVLDEPISGREAENLTNKFKYLTAKLFLSDTSFTMYIARNPLTHNHIITGTTLSIEKLKDLTKNITIGKIKREKRQNKKLFGGRKYNVDFTKVNVGYRNTTLYNALRDFAFINFENIDLEDVINKALEINSQFREPQSDDEVKDVAKSVYSFVAREYNPAFKSDLTEYNRELSKYNAYRKVKELRDGLVQCIMDNVLRVDDLIEGKYSFRFLAKFLPASDKTIKKYYPIIVEWLQTIKWNKDYRLTMISKFGNDKEDIINIFFDISDEFIDFVCVVDEGADDGFILSEVIALLSGITENMLKYTLMAMWAKVKQKEIR